MKVILHMAISLNGMVARDNDDTDFLAHDNWTLFVEIARETGAMVWGRKTHEVVSGYGEQFIKDLDGIGRVVVSGNQQLALEPGWMRAGAPEQALRLLSDAGHEQTLLVGGAAVNTAFAQAGLIDEVVMDIESVLVGSGIPIFAPATFDLRLNLLDMRRVREEIVQLRYQVKR